jgi:hypothetical protein
MPRLVPAAIGAALLLGAALGVGSMFADSLPIDTPLIVLVALGNAAGPWLAVAFVAGALQRDVRVGAAAGLLSLAVAVGAYYVSYVIRWGERMPDPELPALVWLAVAAVAGPLLGAAGGAWAAADRRHRIAGVAVLAGALLAEAVYRFVELEAWDGIDVARTSMQVALVDGLAALLLPLLLLDRDRRRMGYVATAFVGLGGVAVISGVVTMVRAVLASRPG